MTYYNNHGVSQVTAALPFFSANRDRSLKANVIRLTKPNSAPPLSPDSSPSPEGVCKLLPFAPRTLFVHYRKKLSCHLCPVFPYNALIPLSLSPCRHFSTKIIWNSSEPTRERIDITGVPRLYASTNQRKIEPPNQRNSSSSSSTLLSFLLFRLLISCR